MFVCLCPPGSRSLSSVASLESPVICCLGPLIQYLQEFNLERVLRSERYMQKKKKKKYTYSATQAASVIILCSRWQFMPYRNISQCIINLFHIWVKMQLFKMLHFYLMHNSYLLVLCSMQLIPASVLCIRGYGAQCCCAQEPGNPQQSGKSTSRLAVRASDQA